MNIRNLVTNDLPDTPEQCWYQLISNASTSHVDIYLFGRVGSWNVNAQRLVDELREAGRVSTIHVYINSVGGSFADGLALFNLLKQHPATVTTKVMGYCLSMAVTPMLAGDRVEAAENSLIMIHRPQGMADGDKDTMLKAAEILEAHEQAMLPEFVRRMGKTEAEVREMLKNETWFTAEAALKAGLIDAITGKAELDAEKAGASNEWGSIDQHYTMPDNIARFIQNQSHYEDSEMTPEQVEIIAKATAKAVVNELRQEQPTANQAAQTEIANLKTQLAAAEQKAADLTKVDPSKSSRTPENLGPNGDDDYDLSGFQGFM